MASTDLKKKARKLFVDNHASIDSTAALLSVSGRTINRWKEEAKKNGDDWDNARVQVLNTSDEMENTTRDVLSRLVEQCRLAMAHMTNDETLPPAVRVQLLASLADALNKAVSASRRLMPEASRLTIALSVLKELTQFARLHEPQALQPLLDVIEAFSRKLAQQENVLRS